MARNPLYVSQRNDERSGGQAPTQAHMAVQLGQVGDMAGVTPLAVGSHVFFISDPRRADGITECILEKVVFEGSVLKEIRYVAFTRSEKSTRRLVLKAVWEGQYKSGLAPTVEKKEGE